MTRSKLIECWNMSPAVDRRPFVLQPPFAFEFTGGFGRIGGWPTHSSSNLQPKTKSPTQVNHKDQIVPSAPPHPHHNDPNPLPPPYSINTHGKLLHQHHQ